MKKYQLKFRNGELGELRQLDDGSWACPICGEPWVRFPPYYPNDGELGPLHPVSSAELGEVCPGCEVEFGVDEYVSTHAPIGALKEQWSKLRIQWLDRVGWNHDALNQLRDNLGITEDQIRP